MIGDIILWFKEECTLNIRYLFRCTIPEFFKELFCMHNYTWRESSNKQRLTLGYYECTKCGRYKL